MNQHIKQGEEELALDYLNSAQNAFKQAISFGRSYPQSYTSLCHVQQLFIDHAIYRTGEDPTELYQNASTECKKIIEIIPNDSYAFNSMTTNAYRLSEWMNRNGIDSSEILTEALMWNQKSMTIKPMRLTQWPYLEFKQTLQPIP